MIELFESVSDLLHEMFNDFDLSIEVRERQGQDNPRHTVSCKQVKASFQELSQGFVEGKDRIFLVKGSAMDGAAFSLRAGSWFELDGKAYTVKKINEVGKHGAGVIGYRLLAIG